MSAKGPPSESEALFGCEFWPHMEPCYGLYSILPTEMGILGILLVQELVCSGPAHLVP